MIATSLSPIADIFPEAGQIPEEFRLKQAIHQREYLVDGQMRQWDGTTHEVLSPIYVRENGELKRQVIGSYPLTTAAEAMEALDAAVRAYDNGRGQWPTMPIADRIHCMEKFHRQNAREEGRSGQPAHVGDRQVAGRRQQGV
jgi:hypothetical protein